MKLGLALSGGGIRGIAHAGVLAGLEKNNIKIDIIGGTSSGAIVSSLYAMGYSPYHIFILFERYARQIAKLNVIPLFLEMKNFIRKGQSKFDGLRTGKKIEEIYFELKGQEYTL